MALEPRHRNGRIPVLSGLVGIAVAIGTIVGVMTYRGSLELLQRSPSLAGWSWTERHGMTSNVSPRATQALRSTPLLTTPGGSRA